ncbi:MAG: hypothetical protein AMXMBFR33_02820 [Candidatus Xenobia bacterium]
MQVATANPNLSGKNLLGRATHGGLPPKLWEKAQHTREHLVSLESEQELQRFDALYTRAAEKSMNETGDSLIHDAALGAAGLTLLAAGAMAGASGLGGGVSLLAQALGAGAETVEGLAMLSGMFGLFAGALALPIGAVSLACLPIKSRDEKALDQYCDQVFTPGWRPSQSGPLDRGEVVDRWLNDRPSQASRQAGRILGGLLGGALLAPCGAIGGPFACLTVPAAGVLGLTKGGEEGYQRGIGALVPLATGTLMGVGTGALLAFTTVGPGWPVALGAATAGILGAALGGFLGEAGRTPLERDLDSLALWLGKESRYEAVDDPALHKLIRWLVAHPQLTPDQQKFLVQMMRHAQPDDRKGFFESLRGQIASQKLDQDGCGQLLQRLTRHGLTSQKLCDALERALQGDVPGAQGVEETSGRVVLGGISVRRKSLASQEGRPQ